MDEMLSWPGWLTYSGWLTHISGHPSATGRPQDSKSSPAKDQRYTAVPHNQPHSQPTLVRYVSLSSQTCFTHADSSYILRLIY